MSKPNPPFLHRNSKARSKLLAFLPSFILALSLCLSEPPSVLLMAFAAVCFHEGGHLLFFALLTRSLPRFSCDRFGFRLLPHTPLFPHQEFWICLGGPFINILTGICFCRYFGSFGFLIGCMNLLFAFFNLLPFQGSDGGKMLSFVLSRAFSAKRMESILPFLSGAVLAFFFFLSLYTFYITGNGLCGVFFSAFSFPWSVLSKKDDF